MKTEIYYFSGTGNSIYAAREIARGLENSEIVSIINRLKNNRFYSKAETIGFVFPVHAFSIPIPVRLFLNRAELGSARYIFSLATRGGSPSLAFSEIEKILRKKGKGLSSSFYLDMPSNYIPFGLDDDAEIRKKEIANKARIENIIKMIRNQDSNDEKRSGLNFFTGKILFPLIGNFLLPNFSNIMARFYADKKCNGCGNCKKVCLSEKITLCNGSPVWTKEKKCFLCFACINYCPQKSIQIKGSNTAKQGRYHNKFISLMDIAGQK